MHFRNDRVHLFLSLSLSPISFFMLLFLCLFLFLCYVIFIRFNDVFLSGAWVDRGAASYVKRNFAPCCHFSEAAPSLSAPAKRKSCATLHCEWGNGGKTKAICVA